MEGRCILNQVEVGSGPLLLVWKGRGGEVLDTGPPPDPHVTQDKEKEKANSVACHRHEDGIRSGMFSLHGDQHRTSRRMPSPVRVFILAAGVYVSFLPFID